MSPASSFHLAGGVLESQVRGAMPDFYVDCGDFNSAPHGWPASVLTRDGQIPSPQPQCIFFFQKENAQRNTILNVRYIVLMIVNRENFISLWTLF